MSRKLRANRRCATRTKIGPNVPEHIHMTYTQLLPKQRVFRIFPRSHTCSSCKAVAVITATSLCVQCLQILLHFPSHALIKTILTFAKKLYAQYIYLYAQIPMDRTSHETNCILSTFL